MKICVLDDSYEQSGTVFKQFDFLPDPLRYLAGHECERHFLHKATCIKQVMDLAKRGFDVFLNLCDGAWEEDRPGVEVIQALERLGVAFTGATSNFFEPTREAMKRICHYADIGTPAHVTAFDACGIERAAESLRFPLLVKHPNGYASVGITKASRVETAADLRVQATATIEAFGAALIEEFIDGREFTVLVAENPDGAEPIVYQPVEFLFPPGETFKHFDMKWKDYGKMSCVRVDDPVLSAALKEMSGRFFTGLNGAGYGRCDIRMNEHGELFMLEINPNCELFYPPGDEGSGDFILLNDPGGHRGFVDTILKTALKRRAARARSWEIRKGRDGHYGMYAICQIDAGALIEQYEERPHVLVSRSHVERHWNTAQQALFARYAWPLTDEIYVIWSDDPLQWKPINHSCDPNAWLDGLNLTARRKIAPGEHIAIDYATFSNESLEAFRCNCGSANCRGTINGSDFRKPFLDAYGPHVSDYVHNERRNPTS